MNFIEKDTEQLRRIAKIMMPEGDIRPVSYKELEKVPYDQLKAFCNIQAIYGIVTTELVEWLKGRIGDKRAIEIGSGKGTLGKALGIPCTDNHCQSLPEVQIYYQLYRQPTIEYGSNVEKLDGLEAVIKYKPEIVVGSWITDLFDPVKQKGNAYGFDESQMFDHGVKLYILIGNDTIHSDKFLMESPDFNVEKLSFEWLWSRATVPDKNRIYLITKNDPGTTRQVL